MKSLFVRFLVCIIPCLLAGLVTADAVNKYRRGDAGGFKLGVDLVGGTILVYEIDLRKNQDADTKFDPVKDINVLAESLKRRIDPNDLYNITIRPAGGEGRIEIVLPTGGIHRAKKADDVWEAMLKDLQGKFLPNYPGTLEIGRGKILEVADRIQTISSQEKWQDKLFKNPETWDRMRAGLRNNWAKIDNDIRGYFDPNIKQDVPPNKELEKKLNSLPPGDVEGLEKFLLTHLSGTDSATTPKTIQSWIKKQAWEETMTKIRHKWLIPAWNAKTEFSPGDFVIHTGKIYQTSTKSKNEQPPTAGSWQAVKVEDEPFKEDMDRITPDSIDTLTTFVLSKGTAVGQAALALLNPLFGDNMQRVFEDGPDAKEIREFIHECYGRPASDITDSINAYMKEAGHSKDLSVEEVARIKDLVSKVGSLEFRILANINDDKAAQDDMAAFLNDPVNKQLIDEAQAKGMPPPIKLDGEKKPLRYEIQTRDKVRMAVTYSWVELGPQERRSLNLDNAARTDPERSTIWARAKTYTRYKAARIPDTSGAGTVERFMLQGALFYSRESKDRNLPEEERRKKDVEYFVLTRDPEFESLTSTVRTPKIDGSYLVNAYGAPGQDLRPTVHFQFNTAGGELFGNLTRKNVSPDTGPEGTQKRRHLAIILDGLVMSAPTINSEIRTQGQISGNFTQKEVDSLVNILRAGRLPATLKPQPVSESTIAATLGEDTIVAGVQSILLGFFAILLFMIVYYRFAGVVASIALLANLLLTVGFMIAVQATFTLSGMAGLVLTLGMAIDANVLIYERLREERERGASLLQALRNGYDRALPTILDSHVTTILTAVILYVVGNDNLKGFSVSLIVGLVFSLFTSLYMTRFLFDYWQQRGWLTKLTMMRLFAKPDIDFMSIRHVMFGLTFGLAILGTALFIARLPNNLNIDFVGGTAYGGKMTKAMSIKELRPYFDEKRQKSILDGVTVKEIEGTEGRRFDLTFPKGDNKPLTISLSNVPRGETAEAREENVRNRARLLPEPSVDLLFNRSTDPEIIAEINANKSRNFVMRTTEKEPELVQVAVDQLMRDDGQPLLDKVFAHHDKYENRETRFRFYKTEAEAKTAGQPTATASPSFLRSLLNRELRRSFGIKNDKAPLPFVFEVIPEGKSDAEGKFQVMKISFEQGLKEEDFGKVNEALNASVNAFSARPLPDRLENFDSALATETRFRALWAILASWAGILLYLWIRFGSWTFGLAAVTCVVHDILLTLGAIAASYFIYDTFIGQALMLEDFKLDLASVASVLTLVGYSVNDKIVVFDRIREVRGKNPDLTPKMINDSINQTLSRTVLTSMTIAVVFLLYVFGGPGLHLFAFIMMIGVIVGTYSSIYIAAPLLLIFGEGKPDESSMHPAVKHSAPVPEGAFKPAV
jgi:SecD/SecF fusion protein